MKCNYCKKDIPSTKRANARYCTYSCYNLAKRQRDKRSYGEMSQYSKGLKHNFKILEKYYPLCQDEKSMIPIKYFVNEGFDWDRFEKTTLYAKAHLKTIGCYCYGVYPSENNENQVMIWKLIPTQ